MQFSISLILAVALSVTASPLDTESAELHTRTASGCNYFSAPRCCVPNVCECANGAIYQINQDNVNKGLHGCDPPWGYIASSSGAFPGYCC